MNTENLLAHIEDMRQTVNNFRTAKQLRAWASEENAETKKALLLRLEQLRVYVQGAAK